MHLCSSFFLPATPEPRCSVPCSASHLDKDTELRGTFTAGYIYSFRLWIGYRRYTLVKSIWKYSSELCLAWQYDMSSGDSVSVYSEQSLGFIKDASNTSSAVHSLTAPIIAMSGRGSDVKVFSPGSSIHYNVSVRDDKYHPVDLNNFSGTEVLLL